MTRSIDPIPTQGTPLRGCLRASRLHTTWLVHVTWPVHVTWLALAGTWVLGGCGGVHPSAGSSPLPAASGLPPAASGLPPAASGLSPAATASPHVGPAATVERFLAAAALRDHVAMAHLFGTASGPVADPGGAVTCFARSLGRWLRIAAPCASWDEVELRMDLIARVLAHESFRVVHSEAVAGRGRRAERVLVALSGPGGTTLATVPFIVVRTDGGRWLVVEAGLDRVN